MKAQDSRDRAMESRKHKTREAQRASRQRQAARLKAIKSGGKAVKKAWAEVQHAIKEAVTAGQLRVQFDLEHQDEQHGRDYLEALAKELAKRLRQDGYEVDYSVLVKHAVASAPGAEPVYCGHELLMLISWD